MAAAEKRMFTVTVLYTINCSLLLAACFLLKKLKHLQSIVLPDNYLFILIKQYNPGKK